MITNTIYDPYLQSVSWFLQLQLICNSWPPQNLVSTSISEEPNPTFTDSNRSQTQLSTQNLNRTEPFRTEDECSYLVFSAMSSWHLSSAWWLVSVYRCSNLSSAWWLVSVCTGVVICHQHGDWWGVYRCSNLSSAWWLVSVCTGVVICLSSAWWLVSVCTGVVICLSSAWWLVSVCTGVVICHQHGDWWVCPGVVICHQHGDWWVCVQV